MNPPALWLLCIRKNQDNSLVNLLGFSFPVFQLNFQKNPCSFAVNEYVLWLRWSNILCIIQQFQIEGCVLEYSFLEPVDWVDWVVLPGDNLLLLEKIHGEL